MEKCVTLEDGTLGSIEDISCEGKSQAFSTTLFSLPAIERGTTGASQSRHLPPKHLLTSVLPPQSSALGLSCAASLS